MQNNKSFVVEMIGAQSDEACLQQLGPVLSPPDGDLGILIISGGCCHPYLAAEETALENNIFSVLGDNYQGTRIKKIALSDVKRVMDRLDSRLTASVGNLIQERGSAEALPIILINGQLAFYGGVPSCERLSDKLRAPLSGNETP